MYPDKSLDFVRSVECSTRTTSVLLRLGVTSKEDIVLLTKTQVMRLPNAGIRTWREIAALQDDFRAACMTRISEAIKLCRKLTDAAAELPADHRVIVDANGEVSLYRRIGE